MSLERAVRAKVNRKTKRKENERKVMEKLEKKIKIENEKCRIHV